jgi:hypothetical protein
LGKVKNAVLEFVTGSRAREIERKQMMIKISPGFPGAGGRNE